MELEVVLKERRSVRKYQADRKVDKAVVEELIQAAILAPSWKNSQTARYYCVMSEEMLKKVKEECLPEFNRASCADAPVLLVTTFVRDRSGFGRDGKPDNEVGNGWGYYDLGLHNENLLLKAKDLGLDTLVMGIRDGERLGKLLEIDSNQIVVAVIALGYGNAAPEMPKRKAVDEIARFY